VDLYLHSSIHLHGMVLSLVQDVFMAWYLIKERDKFTFTKGKAKDSELNGSNHSPNGIFINVIFICYCCSQIF